MSATLFASLKQCKMELKLVAFDSSISNEIITDNLLLTSTYQLSSSNPPKYEH